MFLDGMVRRLDPRVDPVELRGLGVTLEKLGEDTLAKELRGRAFGVAMVQTLLNPDTWKEAMNSPRGMAFVLGLVAVAGTLGFLNVDSAAAMDNQHSDINNDRHPGIGAHHNSHTGIDMGHLNAQTQKWVTSHISFDPAASDNHAENGMQGSLKVRDNFGYDSRLESATLGVSQPLQQAMWEKLSSEKMNISGDVVVLSVQTPNSQRSDERRMNQTPRRNIPLLLASDGSIWSMMQMDNRGGLVGIPEENISKFDAIKDGKLVKLIGSYAQGLDGNANKSLIEYRPSGDAKGDIMFMIQLSKDGSKEIIVLDSKVPGSKLSCAGSAKNTSLKEISLTATPTAPNNEANGNGSILSPEIEVIRGELPGNPFSGESIHTTAVDFEKNPTLSQSDLDEMGKYILQLYKDGQIRQFPDGAMQLGTSDLEMSQEAFTAGATTNVMFSVPYVDFRSKRWAGNKDQRPFVPGVFPATEPGGRWAPQIWLQKDGTPGLLWYLQPVGWDGVKWDKTTIVKMLTEYDPARGGNSIPVPLDFKTAEACQKYTWTPELDKVCAQLMKNRSQSRALLSKMLKTGMIPAELQSGKVYFIPSFKGIVYEE